MKQFEIQEYKNNNYDNSNIIIMDEIPEYDKEDYDLFNSKSFEKYLKDIENKVIRQSMEYREFIQYLRNYMDMNKCAFFKNVTNINTAKIKIHLHHYPFTLYDLVITVYNKRCACKESLEVEMVGKEVMYIHYFLYVGLVPLAETAHELVHNQLLFVPLNIVLGKYNSFIEMYEKYIPDDAINRLNTYKELTEKYDEITNTSILKTIPIYLKLPGSDPNSIGLYGLPKLQELSSLIENKLEQLKTDAIKGLLIDSTYDNNSNNKMIKPFTIFTKEDNTTRD